MKRGCDYSDGANLRRMLADFDTMNKSKAIFEYKRTLTETLIITIEKKEG